VRTPRLWRRLLGVEHTVIELMNLESDRWGSEVLIERARRAGRPGRSGTLRGGSQPPRRP
jgi:hypothetical protein